MSSEATIRRGVRNARYAAIPNHVFEDERLSMEARWLLSYLLSKPDNWTVVIGDITKRGGCGRDKARKMIAELVTCGYAEREQQRDDGKFGSSVLVIYDEPSIGIHSAISPESESVAFLPQTDLPATAKPSPVLPSPVNPTLVITDNLVITENQTPREGVREDLEKEESAKALESRFRKWWAMWPSYADDSESKTRRAWLALTPEQRAACEARTPEILALRKTMGRTKPKAASTYLAERAWERLAEIAASPEGIAAAALRQKAERIPAPAFGPVWAGLRMLSLLRGPEPVDIPLDLKGVVTASYEVMRRSSESASLSFLARRGIDLAADGSLCFPDGFERDEQRRRTLEAGYPEANRLHDAVRNHTATTADARHAALKDLCEPVKRDSVLFDAWRQHHDAMGWPFVPDAGSLPVVWFPKGGPDGLGEFEAAARAVKDQGSEQ